jgi:hypothetical protein
MNQRLKVSGNTWESVKWSFIAMIVVIATLGVGLGIPMLGSSKPDSASQTLHTFSRPFGNGDYENVTISQMPVGTSVTFQEVEFTRAAYSGLPNEPNGFNMTWIFLSSGFHGGGAVPSQDGSYSWASNPSQQAAGYIVYPSQGIIEFLVKD